MQDDLLPPTRPGGKRAARGLGRGLDALLPTPPATGLREIDIDGIDPNPRQPRQRFETQRLEELADSVRVHGVVQPVIVTFGDEDRFRLIVGERRWQAARLAGLARIPAIVTEASDVQTLELALVENVQRADLNPLEEAGAFQRLIEDFHLTQQQVSDRVGKSRVSITNTLRLLSLPETIKRALVEGRITEGHARVLLQLPDRQTQLAALDRIEREGWTVRQTEERVRMLTGRKVQRSASTPGPNVQAAERVLRDALGAPVSVKPGKRGGRIVIQYGSDEEFDSLYQLLTGTL